MSHPDEYKAAAEGRLGADRMALGLSIIPDKNRGDMDKVATLTRQRDGLVELLETCLCPDPHCNNIGTTWHMEQHGPDDVEQVPEPCAWCDLRAKALAAAKETP